MWLYAGENDAMRLERGHGTNLESEVLETMLSKMTIDPCSISFMTPPAHCMPICMDQAARSLLLKVMPMMDDIDITSWQRGNQSCGVHTSGMDATIGRGVLTSPRDPAKGRRR
jgi:hypothetical protein